MTSNDFTQPLPPPTPGEGPSIWDLVVADMRAKDERGQAKYGKPLQAFDGRDPEIDMYQEILDLAVYFRKKLYERYGQ